MNSTQTDDFAQKRAAFLAAAGWQGIEPIGIEGDASTKNFYALTRKNGERVILMHMPIDHTAYSARAAIAKTCRPFLAINAYLTDKNISVPKILTADPDQGFVLLEHLGDVPYDASWEHIQIGIDILLRLHQERAPATISFPQGQEAYPLPIFTPEVFLTEARLFLEWFLPHHNIRPDSETERAFDQFWQENFDRANFGAPVILLRDYHSPNFIFIAERAAYRRLGVLDHQDALAGPPAYDLVSMLQDARMDISAERENKGLDDYLARTRMDEKKFRRSYALLGAQRALKIMGIFVRFAQLDQKPHYLGHMPRIISYLKRNLVHEALAPLKSWLARYEKIL